MDFFLVFPQNESPDLTEEQLLGLLDECEPTDSWTQDLETYGTTLWDPRKDSDGPDLSEALFSEDASLIGCHYHAIRGL